MHPEVSGPFENFPEEVFRSSRCQLVGTFPYVNQLVLGWLRGRGRLLTLICGMVSPVKIFMHIRRKRIHSSNQLLIVQLLGFITPDVVPLIGKRGKSNTLPI